MGNPLLAFWNVFVDRDRDIEEPHRDRDRDAAFSDPAALTAPSTAAIFLVLRRMRAPLIVLIAVFSIAVLGLTLIPGQQPDGGTDAMSFFDAFYFMSYTATTIGFGEIPNELTIDQRMWVTFSIYLAVIGWAYAIGTLLGLLQDRGFRKSLETQRFSRQVGRIPVPFLTLVGYAEAGALVARDLDTRGRRLVVVDRVQDRIDSLALEALRADVPALSANPRAPQTLILAGLINPRCAGVLALTDDDETNLAVVQAVHLIRPGLPVVARADSPLTVTRMAAFGAPTVVNPYDAFGDRLRIALRTPSLSQLVDWLILPPGAPLPPRPEPPEPGEWVVVGSQRVIGEVLVDLQAVDIPVTVVDPGPSLRAGTEDLAAHGPAPDFAPQSPAFAALAARSVGVVVAADRDTTTVSYVDAARRANPGIVVIARQESSANGAVFAALGPDLLLRPSEVVAREVLERLANPVLWAFLQAAKAQSEAWAAQVSADLEALVGVHSPTVWPVRIDPAQAPALCRRVAREPVRIGQLMASPFARDERLGLMALMHVRGTRRTLVPGPDQELIVGDVLLMAGARGTPRAWEATLHEDASLSYVLAGQTVATSWWGRRLLRG
ncbi:MAG: potassium channel family protein [Candidatus Nanopelagicales bacterium]